MGTFIFHPPVEIYNLDHRTEERNRRKECGCLKTDNPFQDFPHGIVLLWCAAYLFSRKKLLCTSCGRVVGENDTDTDGFGGGGEGNINCTGELGGDFHCVCPCVRMALQALMEWAIYHLGHTH